MKTDDILSFILVFLKNEDINIHNALFIAQKLSGERILDFRGAGTQGMKSLELYAIMSEMTKGNTKLNSWAEKLKKLDSHQLKVVAAFLQNEGGSLSQSERGEALILLKEELGVPVTIDLEVSP